MQTLDPYVAGLARRNIIACILVIPGRPNPALQCKALFSDPFATGILLPPLLPQKEVFSHGN
jgi:hypothetical protein